MGVGRRSVCGSLWAVPVVTLYIAAVAPTVTPTDAAATATATATTSIRGAFVTEYHGRSWISVLHPKKKTMATRCKLPSSSKASLTTLKTTKRWWEDGPPSRRNVSCNALFVGSPSPPPPPSSSIPRRHQLFSVSSPRHGTHHRNVDVSLYGSSKDDTSSPAARQKFPPLRSVLDIILFLPKFFFWQLFRVVSYLHRAAFRIFVRGMAATCTAIIIDPALNRALANAVKDGLNLWITQPQFKEKLLRFQRNLSQYEGSDGKPSSLARPIGQDFPRVLLDFVIGVLSLPNLGGDENDDDDDVDKENGTTPFQRTMSTLSTSSRHRSDKNDDDENDDNDDNNGDK